MKKILLLIIILGSFSAFSQSVLTNKDIISLTESKIAQSLISTKVKSSNSNFNLSTKGIIDLKSNKVSDRIINEMIENTDFSTPISNQDIIELNNNKITFSVIKSLIRKAPNNFDLDTDGLIQLKSEKVSTFITKEMIASSSPNTDKKTAETEKTSAKNDENLKEIIIVRDIEEVKGLTRIEEISASAKKLYGSQDKLREEAINKIKNQARKLGATHVYIQKDEFQATPINNVYMIGVAYKK